MPDGSLRAAVVSYTAFSPLPDRSGGLFSAALSFPRIAPRHPSLHGRTPCSAESGLSSSSKNRRLPADTSTIIYVLFPKSPMQIRFFRKLYAKKRSETAVPDRFSINPITDYCCVMASAGQPATQAPQSMQVPSSTVAAPSFMVIAPTGQVPVHASHPTHFDASTFAAIMILLFSNPCGWLPQGW